MTNPEWDNATVEEKLEMLRKDLFDAVVAHNALAKAHNREITKIAADLEELKKIRRRNGGA